MRQPSHRQPGCGITGLRHGTQQQMRAVLDGWLCGAGRSLGTAEMQLLSVSGSCSSGAGSPRLSSSCDAVGSSLRPHHTTTDSAATPTATATTTASTTTTTAAADTTTAAAAAVDAGESSSLSDSNSDWDEWSDTQQLVPPAALCCLHHN